jgi:predicted acetyltransferase
MTYRKGTADDVTAVADLLFHSFPGSRSREERARAIAESPFGGVDSLRVLERGGVLLASMNAYAMNQWVHGAKLPVLGVASVAVAPEQRRKGLARDLMRHVLREGLSRGDVASLLYPFRPSFYRNLGYALTGTMHEFEVRPDSLPLFAERERIRRATLVDVPAMSACYRAFAEATTGQLERTDAQIARLANPAGGAAFVFESEERKIEGFLVMRYGFGEVNAGRAEVLERVWTTQQAYRGILGFLGSMGDQWSELVLRTHPHERLENLLADPRPTGFHHVEQSWFPVSRRLKGTMFRLLNVAEALRRRRYGPGTVSFAVSVEDTILEENSGVFKVKVEGGKAEVREGAAGEDLRVGVSTLSSMFLGEMPPSRAASIGELTVATPEILPLLDLAFSGPGPWTYDVF